MAVYGYKDNKCKAELPTVFADVADEFPGGTYVDAPNISTVGNGMPENSIAYYHVNSSGFPGSGAGTITVFKSKGGTYKNYLFFDNVNNEFYAMAADGTSKSWVRLCSVGTVYTRTTTISANSSYETTFASSTAFSSKAAFTVEVSSEISGTTTNAPIICNVCFGESNVGIRACLNNLSENAVDVTLKVKMIAT